MFTLGQPFNSIKDYLNDIFEFLYNEHFIFQFHQGLSLQQFKNVYRLFTPFNSIKDYHEGAVGGFIAGLALLFQFHQGLSIFNPCNEIV